jgi:hypothetical protein
MLEVEVFFIHEYVQGTSMTKKAYFCRPIIKKGALFHII